MPPLYTFYGDDFTGSTDVLEQLAANGVRSALFLAPPASALLQKFSGLQAFGIAGDSRSRSPEWMSKHLPSTFAALRRFHSPIVHYKVCSTFDSSPAHGSIGRAIELGIDVFHPRFVPIVVGSPHLRRFVFEGRLFASGPDGEIHRIDRHPMSRHPVTPMREPDLRRHLQKQTRLALGHVAHTQLHTHATASKALNQALSAGSRAILFDTVDSHSLEIAANLLWQSAYEEPLFCAASSGLTAGLIAAWRKHGVLHAELSTPAVEPISPLLVVSGSCSVATSRQIEWAAKNGFETIHADTIQMLDPKSGESYRNKLVDQLTRLIAQRRDTVLYTSLGNSPTEFAGETLGTTLGSILQRLLTATSVGRVVLCGGDTSSHAVQQLGIAALTWKASLQPGAPLCQVHFADHARPLELVLKGGQAGRDDFFAVAKGTRQSGRAAATADQTSLKP